MTESKTRPEVRIDLDSVTNTDIDATPGPILMNRSRPKTTPGASGLHQRGKGVMNDVRSG